MIICHGWGRLSKFEVLEEIILKKRPEKFLQDVQNLHISKGQKKKKKKFVENMRKDEYL